MIGGILICYLLTSFQGQEICPSRFVFVKGGPDQKEFSNGEEALESEF